VAHHARTAVVLLYPAGAATAVSAGAQWSASNAHRFRGLSTAILRTLGIAIFASTSGSGAAASIGR
jgi:hypothetical protein